MIATVHRFTLSYHHHRNNLSAAAFECGEKQIVASGKFLYQAVVAHTRILKSAMFAERGVEHLCV
jgi:hypothetical protein